MPSILHILSLQDAPALAQIKALAFLDNVVQKLVFPVANVSVMDP
jgi:hypothetical protein